MDKSIKIGVVIAVEGNTAQIGMYSLSNDPYFLFNGEMLMGPKVGAKLTILQNDVKLIASVISEKVIDQQNTVKSHEFDNRYHKDSINRILIVNTQGVIKQGNFTVTNGYVPMIGNEITLTSKEDLATIFHIKDEESTVYLGESLLEHQKIRLSINDIFASHIGIFGNTGSGKSNTLHKLFLQLFQLKSYFFKMNSVSKFFVIDFNGEYVGKRYLDYLLNTRRFIRLILKIIWEID